MKKLFLLLLLGGLCFAGYKYVDWGAVTGGGGSIFKTRPEYPITRTITSKDGKTLDVVILGKAGETIFLQRQSDGKSFKLERARLSDADSDYVASLPDGGRERPPTTAAEVVWHTDFSAASGAAQASQTPIFLLFDGSGW